MKQYKIKKWVHLLTVAAVSAMLFAGCGNERLENELSYRTIGINCMQSGDYEGAVTAFESALKQRIGKIGDTEMDICYYKAAAQFAAGDIEGALATYQSILDYDEKNSDALYLKGCILLQQQDTQGALKCYENAIKNDADNFERYIHIYENLSAYGLTEEGTGYLNKAFEIKGSDADSLASRGKIYLLLGEYDNAKAELTAALEKGSITANLYLAQVYDAQGDSQSAQEHYQAYVDAGEADSIAMNALAEIEIGKGNYTEALAYINQGLSMEVISNRRALMQNQIIACEYTGDFVTAWNVIQEYIVLYPEDASAQREYTFLKNRQGPVEIQAEIVSDGGEAVDATENVDDTQQ